jgi:signal transduction histidine kinase/CheY-like chemotaxis protein
LVEVQRINTIGLFCQSFDSRTIRLLPGFLFAAPQGSDTSTWKVDLHGKWKFKTGDDLRWADPGFDDSSWQEIEVPIPWGRQGHYAYSGFAWYRKKIRIDPEKLGSLYPGITLSYVDSSYEIYAGGQKIGGIGALPPSPKMEYDRIATFTIPQHSITKDGLLVLSIRVWKSPEKDLYLGGLYEGKFMLGSVEWLVHQQFLEQIPALLLSAIFFFVGLYHLHLFLRRRNLKEYLWFGLLSGFNAAFYTFLRSQWRFVLTDNFMLLKELEYLSAFLFLPIFIQFLWSILNRSISLPLRVYQFFHIAVAIVCLTPGLKLNLVLLPIWEVAVILFIPLAVFLIIKNALKGNPESRTIAIGMIITIGTVLNDIAVDRTLIQSPRLMPYGFAVFVLSMAVSLSNRFNRVYSELDALRTDLENRVQERTLQLTAQTQETSEVNQKLSELNSKLSEVNTKLSERSRELAEATIAKSQFLANMGHELRTPLNAIIGYSEMIQEDAEDKGMNELVPDLKKIRDAGKHLLGIINDILDLSKIEAGNAALYIEAFKISMMVEDLGTTASPLIEKNNNSLKIHYTENIGTMRADIKRVRQVLLNLLSNAAKFTENGIITLEASRESNLGTNWIIFKVADTGIGMSDDQKSKVFRAFSQVDDSATRKYGGAGLGLVICKRYCEMMGGNIAFESEKGKGSTFTVRLPEVVMDLKQEGPPVSEFTSDIAAHRTVFGMPDGRGIVLVIDDDRSARDLMVRMIAREGFRVVTAWGGEEGLRLARDLQPALITLDVLMPGIDGWTVLKELKADPDLAKIPVILITMEEDRNKGILLGAADFMSKPIQRDELATALNKYVLREIRTLS